MAAGRQWQRRSTSSDEWEVIATEPTYILPAVNDEYRAAVCWQDGQGYGADGDQCTYSESVRYSGSEVQFNFNDDDIDDDNDGLIEIYYLEQLDAIRHQPDGSGLQLTADGTKNTNGCPSTGCRGYELMRDLSFGDPNSYASGTVKSSWIADPGFPPILPFSAVLKGNGYVIDQLLQLHAIGNGGLFRSIAAGATVDGLGIKVIENRNSNTAGGLAGTNRGTIINSYVIPSTTPGEKGIWGNNVAGGLVGSNIGQHAFIGNSYAQINVEITAAADGANKGGNAGGLVGVNTNGATITNSYATGTAKSTCGVGGLVGLLWTSSNAEKSRIVNSYATGDAQTGVATCNVAGNRRAGGLVSNANGDSGAIGGLIKNSYATGSVSSLVTLGSNGNLGGLIATKNNGSTIENSYFPLQGRTALNDTYDRTAAQMQSPTAPAAANIYQNWHTNNWGFGTSSQYPLIKYANRVDAPQQMCGVGIELPACGRLIPGQGRASILLNKLELPDFVSLSPAFDSTVVRYDTQIIADTLPVSIVLYAEADNDSMVTVSIDGGSALSDSENADDKARVTLNLTAATTATIRIENSNAPSETLQYRMHIKVSSYNLSINQSLDDASPISLSSNAITIDEGEQLKLEAMVSSSRDIQYRWQQRSGRTLLSEPVARATLTLHPPPDFVARADTNTQIVLELSIFDGVQPPHLRRITVTINKIDNGINAPIWISEEMLSLPEVIDPDGDPPSHQISYQWFNATTNQPIEGATSKTLSVGRSQDQYQVRLFYTDGQGYDYSAGELSPRANPIAIDKMTADRDSDGLIELRYIEDLIALNNSLDGTHFTTMTTAITRGCPPAGCFGYELTRDLDFNNPFSYRSGRVAIADNNATNWDGVGDASNEFNATFDGNGYTIAGMRRENNSSPIFPSYIGFFNTTGDNSEIKRFGLIDIMIDLVGFSSGTDTAIGGLVGRFKGVIRDSYVSGHITINSDIKGSDGGLVGRSLAGEIENSYTDVAVRGRVEVGGLVGRLSGNSLVEHSFTLGSTAIVNNNIGDLNNRSIGGLVGRSNGDSGIKSSYALGAVDYNKIENVSLGLARVGGLVGSASSSTIIENSYAHGTVGRYDFRGGLVGESDRNTVIRNSYAMGQITGVDGGSSGGLIAVNNGIVKNSYWATDTTGQPYSDAISAGNPSYRGFTSLQLQAPTAAGNSTALPYYNWNSEHWDFGNNEQYPVLKYADDSCENGVPPCGLLPYQRDVGLRELTILHNSDGTEVRIEPPFVPQVTDYQLLVDSAATALTIIPRPVNAAAEVIITVDGVVSGFEVTLNDSGNTQITIEVIERFTEISAIEYHFTVSNRLPNISSMLPLLPVAEGDTIVIRVAVNDADRDPLSYQWRAAADSPAATTLLSSLDATTGTIANGFGDITTLFTIPNRFVDKAATDTTASMLLDISDTTATVIVPIDMIINKRNNGAIAPPPPHRNGLIRTAVSVDLATDPDGGGDNDNIRYQWQQQLQGAWHDIAAATTDRYTIGSRIADDYRVLYSYRDGQGYDEQRIPSAATVASDGRVRVATSAESQGGLRFLTMTLPDFSREVTRYEVANDVTAVGVTARADSGRILINDRLLADTELIDDISLNLGENIIKVEWQSSDGSSTEVYEATVERTYDALSSLSINDGTDTHSFGSDGNVLPATYTVNVAHTISAITLSAQASSGTMIVVNSATGGARSFDTTVAAFGVDLNFGITTITLSTLNLEDEQYTYTLEVTRLFNAALQSLSLSPIEGNFDFASDTYAYSVNVTNETAALNIAATATATVRMITIIAGDNEQMFNTSTVQQSVALAFGENTIAIVVTTENSENTYTITAHRDYSLLLQSLAIAGDSSRYPYDDEQGGILSRDEVYSFDNALQTATLTMTAKLGAEISIIENNITSATYTITSIDEVIEFPYKLPFTNGELRIEVTIASLTTTPTEYNLLFNRDISEHLQSLSLQDTAYVFPTDSDGVIAQTYDDIEVTSRTLSINMSAQIGAEIIVSDNHNQSTTYTSSISMPFNIMHPLELDFGTNDIVIRVIDLSSGGQRYSTYHLVINRPVNNQLQSLSLQNIDYIFDYDDGGIVAKEYIVTVDANNITTTTLIGQSNVGTTIQVSKISDGNDAQTYHGNETTPTALRYPLELDIGRNSIKIEVTSALNSTQTYILHIDRQQYSSQLQTLAVTGATLNPNFRPANIEYTAMVANLTTATVVSATASAEAILQLSVDGEVIAEYTGALTSNPILLVPGEDTKIEIKVIAQDQTSSTYVITVRRILSSDNNLHALSFAGVSAQTVDFSTATVTYNLLLHNALAMTSVQAEAYQESQIALTVNGSAVGTTVKGRLQSAEFNLIEGTTTVIVIRVTAQNGTSKDYTVNVLRAASDVTNVRLASIELSTLSEDETQEQPLPFLFDESVQRYTIEVGGAVEKIRVRPIVSDSAATISSVSANSEQISELSGFWEVALALDTSSTIVITVQNSDNSGTYTLIVTRLASTDASLSALSASNSSGLAPYDINTTRYTAVLGNATTSTVVSATANHPSAQVYIYLAGTDAGIPSHSVTKRFSIAEGMKSDIVIKVSAQERSVEQEYHLAVSREGSAGMITFSLSNVEITPLSDTTYQADISSDSDDTRVELRRSGGSGGAVTVQHVYISDGEGTRTDKVKDGTALNLAPNTKTEVSAPITLDQTKSNLIEIILRVVDQTPDGYTDETYAYTLTFRQATIRIRSKVFLEGPLR